jgi:hypothetical protein
LLSCHFNQLPHQPSELDINFHSPMTSELCSDRASVLGSLPLGAPSSRCSLDLSPLRGSPVQPSGLRPPLMCLLHLRFPRLATSLPWVSRHSRVSIRPNLETAPESGLNLREVFNLFRSPQTLVPTGASSCLYVRIPPRERGLIQRVFGCHSLCRPSTHRGESRPSR